MRGHFLEHCLFQRLTVVEMLSQQSGQLVLSIRPLPQVMQNLADKCSSCFEAHYLTASIVFTISR